MKLKTFDIFDMLDGIENEKAFQIMREVAPFCLYAPENKGMAICLLENKEPIVSTIKRHAEELGLKVRVQGNFVNLSTELIGDNVDWDDIVLGNSSYINSDDFWKEVIEVVSAREDELIASNNFVEEWRMIKIAAVKTVIIKWHQARKKELDEQYDQLISLWSDLEDVPLF